jgi:predicted MPP superfamily phosphohydrolase
MNRYAQFAAFLGFALTMSLLAGYYAMSRVFGIFGLAAGPLFWPAVIVAALLFIAGMGLSAISDTPRLRQLNIALGVWTGFYLMLLFLLMIYDLVGIFYRWPDGKMAGTALFALAVVLAGAAAVNARFVRRRAVKLPGRNLEKPIRIVQLSDLHLGPVNGLNDFRRIVERVNREAPDLVLITGDFIDGRLADGMFAPLNDIKAPVFFVPGNHEEYVGMDEFLAHLSRTKAVPLCNRKVDLGNIVLAGIDFDWSAGALETMVSKVAPADGKYSILMSHGPPAFDAARKAGFDLTLSGHTHGGQFWPFVFLGRLFVKYRAGLYERDGKRLFVTTGTGTWGPPLRLMTNSEIAVIDIG